jgi:hypothetical protein
VREQARGVSLGFALAANVYGNGIDEGTVRALGVQGDPRSDDESMHK